MAFKRAQYHTGLTYMQTCRLCRTTFSYTDYQLDYRFWYADGFIYCPKCNTPLRHNENFAVMSPAGISFCTKCGKEVKAGDSFCRHCGTKIH